MIRFGRWWQFDTLRMCSRSCLLYWMLNEGIILKKLCIRESLPWSITLLHVSSISLSYLWWNWLQPSNPIIIHIHMEEEMIEFDEMPKDAFTNIIQCIYEYCLKYTWNSFTNSFMWFARQHSLLFVPLASVLCLRSVVFFSSDTI